LIEAKKVMNKIEASDWAVIDLIAVTSSTFSLRVDLLYRIVDIHHDPFPQHCIFPFIQGECYFAIHDYDGNHINMIPENAIDYVAQVIHGWSAILYVTLDAVTNVHRINSLSDLDKVIDTLPTVSTSKFAHQLRMAYYPKSIVNRNAIAWRQITNAIINPFERVDAIHYLLIEGISNDHLFERAAEMFGYAMRPLRINDGMLFYTHYGKPRLKLSFFGPVIPNLDTKLGYVSYTMPGIVLLHACVAKKMQVQIRAKEGIVKTTDNAPIFEDMRMYLNKNLPICIKLENSAAVAKKVEMRKQHEDYLTGRFSEGLRKGLGLEF
jgi:hypothetical protein